MVSDLTPWNVLCIYRSKIYGSTGVTDPNHELHVNLTEDQARVLAQQVMGNNPWPAAFYAKAVTAKFGPIVKSSAWGNGSDPRWRTDSPATVKIWKNGSDDKLEIWPRPADYDDRLAWAKQHLEDQISKGRITIDYWAEPGFVWVSKSNLATVHKWELPVPSGPLKSDELKPVGVHPFTSFFRSLFDR